MNLDRRVRQGRSRTRGRHVGACAARGVGGASAQRTSAASAAADVTLTVWDQEVRGGQAAAITKLNARVPDEVPEHQDQPRREVVHRPPGDAQARGLRAEPARRRRGEQRLLGDGAARQGEPAALAEQVRRQATAGAPATRPGLLKMNQFTADGKSFGTGNLYGHPDDRRGRRRLLQQGQAAQARPGACRRRSRRSSRRSRRRRRPARRRSSSATSTSGPASTSTRRSCSSTSNKALRARLHLRRGRRQDELRRQGHGRGGREAASAGRRRAPSPTATPASATTRRGRTSARATASS